MNLLITGVSGFLGQAVVSRLMRDNPFRRVFGVDLGAPRLLGPVQFLRGDIRSDDLGDLIVMNDVSVVLHLAHAFGGLGGRRGALDVVRSGSRVAAREEIDTAQSLFEACALAEVRRVVLANSAGVYAPRADGVEAPYDENAPLVDPAHTRSPRVAGKARVERLAGTFAEANPAVEVVSIRLSNILGPTRGTPIDEVLALPFVIAPTDRRPAVHFLHVEDAAEIFTRTAARGGLRGALNAAGPEPITLDDVAGILEKPVLRPPRWAVAGAFGALRRIRLTGIGQSDVSRLYDGVTLDLSRLRTELGFEPRYTTRQTLAVWRTRYVERPRDRMR